jgi:hypothetical protein
MQDMGFKMLLGRFKENDAGYKIQDAKQIPSTCIRYFALCTCIFYPLSRIHRFRCYFSAKSSAT